MENLAAMPKYESYKDSGVDWLGCIPESWSLKPGLVAFSENKRNNKGMKESTVLSLSYGKIVIKPEEKLVGLVPESFETYQLVEPSDIIIRCTDLQNDKVSLRTALAKNKGIITSAYLNLKVKKGFNSRFLHYYFHSLDTTKVIYKFGSGLRQNLSFLDFKRLPIFDIPETTQTAIAEYLDQKTAQIDEAIAIKEKQITLLKERKQIIIQKAVTQGLDPNVVMKDSGMEWVGQIPVHWKLIKLKYLSKLIQTGPFGTELHAHDYVIAGIPLINPKHMVNGRLMPDDDCSVDQETALRLKKYKLQSGDLVLARRGELGRCAVVSQSEEGWMCGTGSVMLRPERLVSIEYLYRLISGQGVSKLLSLESVGSTMDNLNTTILGNVELPVPSIDEQVEIINFIGSQSLKIEESIFVQNQQIEKLKEYKTTLINNAVTGKIKVA